MKKWGIWLTLGALLVAGGWWGFRQLNKPLPGETVAELGREHVTDISNIAYNSNPPTSGSHFSVWAKRGLYDRLISDGYLIHSLEHGYIIISYNCEKKISNFPIRQAQGRQFLISNVSAHETEEPHEEPATDSGKPLTQMKVTAMSFFTPDNQPKVEVELTESFKTEECKKLAQSLWDVVDDKKRVIVVPRLNLDAKIALTAWGRILKLDEVDEFKIRDFVSSFENMGPEKTQE